MGKLNFHGHLISQFYPTLEIRKNFMHTKITWFTVIIFTEKPQLKAKYSTVN